MSSKNFDSSFAKTLVSISPVSYCMHPHAAYWRLLASTKFQVQSPAHLWLLTIRPMLGWHFWLGMRSVI